MKNPVGRASVSATLILLLKSSPVGTGFPACVDRLAGEDARPTDLSGSQ